MFYDLPQLFVETATYSRDDLRQECVDGRMHPDDIEQLMQLYACGDSFRDETKDIPGAIENALGNRGSYRVARERYFNWVFGSRDRLAATRVAEALKNLRAETEET